MDEVCEAVAQNKALLLIFLSILECIYQKTEIKQKEIKISGKQMKLSREILGSIGLHTAIQRADDDCYISYKSKPPQKVWYLLLCRPLPFLHFHRP
jgi:hypothetical protein